MTLTPEHIWSLLLALRRQIRQSPTLSPSYYLGLAADGQPVITSDESANAALRVASNSRWDALRPLEAASATLLDLYLPLALAHPHQPITIAHLGQSLDGRIATVNGVSRYVTGPDNLTHLHRLRALCDAILVGAATVECDDPQLTTRRVTGPNPVRVVLDPQRRLATDRGLFHDQAAPTLLACAEDRMDAPAPGFAELLGLPMNGATFNLRALVQRLRARKLFGLFIEGGGLTVSGFLEQGRLDRLHLTIAPLIIGSGRLGLQLPPIAELSAALRPRHRCYVMGEDLLFDCQLST